MRVASEPDALLAVLKNPAVVVAIGSPVVVAMQSAGLYYCAACNGQFTVTVGTVMVRATLPNLNFAITTAPV